MGGFLFYGIFILEIKGVDDHEELLLDNSITNDWKLAYTQSYEKAVKSKRRKWGWWGFGTIVVALFCCGT